MITKEVNNMKKATIKGMFFGIMLTLLVEVGIFVYETCDMSTKVTYTYNPSNIMEMVPEATEFVTIK